MSSAKLDQTRSSGRPSCCCSARPRSARCSSTSAARMAAASPGRAAARPSRSAGTGSASRSAAGSSERLARRDRLAMGLLGPGPGRRLRRRRDGPHSAVRRLPPAQWLNNLAIFAVVPFAGGLVMALWQRRHRRTPATTSATRPCSAWSLFGVVPAHDRARASCCSPSTCASRRDGALRPVVAELIPLLPGELAAGALATILAVAYTSVGLPVLFAAIVVLLIFQSPDRRAAALGGARRAAAEPARRQLVGLQLGVLRTLVRALGMRDQTTARHAAAVALYAKALAGELGCGEEEQDTVHTAGLLHDIGKFTWPDRVLHARRRRRRGPGDRPQPPAGGLAAGRRARRLRPRRRRDPLPPRARRRPRLPRPA